MSTPPSARIGEIANRLGVSVAVLRTWEQRYGVVEPDRTPGGARVYTRDDVERLRQMVALTRRGVPAGEAARTVLGRAIDGFVARPEAPTLEVYRRQLDVACAGFDEGAAHEAIDRLLGAFDVPTVLGRVVLPYLREVGDRWQRGEATVAQEHFASTLVRARLLGLARGWDRGTGARALLACPAGEHHDIGLVVFGLALRQAGWRIVFLGGDTPSAAVDEVATGLGVDLVVLSSVDPACLARALRRLRLPPAARLAVGGAGAARVEHPTAIVLPDDVLDAAATVARDHGRDPAWGSGARGPGRDGTPG